MTHLQLVPRVLQLHPNGPACPAGVKGALYYREVCLSADYRARRAEGILRNKRQLAAFVKRAVTRAVKGGNLPAVALDSRIDVYHADPEDSGVVDFFVDIDICGQSVSDRTFGVAVAALSSITVTHAGRSRSPDLSVLGAWLHTR